MSINYAALAAKLPNLAEKTGVTFDFSRTSPGQYDPSLGRPATGPTVVTWRASGWIAGGTKGVAQTEGKRKGSTQRVQEALEITVCLQGASSDFPGDYASGDEVVVNGVTWTVSKEDSSNPGTTASSAMVSKLRLVR